MVVRSLKGSSNNRVCVYARMYVCINSDEVYSLLSNILFYTNNVITMLDLFAKTLWVIKTNKQTHNETYRDITSQFFGRRLQLHRTHVADLIQHNVNKKCLLSLPSFR